MKLSCVSSGSCRQDDSPWVIAHDGPDEQRDDDVNPDETERLVFGRSMMHPEFEDLPFFERPDLTPFLIHLTKNTKGETWGVGAV